MTVMGPLTDVSLLRRTVWRDDAGETSIVSHESDIGVRWNMIAGCSPALPVPDARDGLICLANVQVLQSAGVRNDLGGPGLHGPRCRAVVMGGGVQLVGRSGSIGASPRFSPTRSLRTWA